MAPLPKGHLSISEDIFGGHNVVRGDCYWYLVSTVTLIVLQCMRQFPITKNNLAQNVSSAKA